MEDRCPWEGPSVGDRHSAGKALTDGAGGSGLGGRRSEGEQKQTLMLFPAPQPQLGSCPHSTLPSWTIFITALITCTLNILLIDQF